MHRTRWARTDDADALGRVMFRAVREGPAPYTEAQRRAWTPDVPGGSEWGAKLAAQTIAVAMGAEGLVGFVTTTPDGEVDLAFLLPEARGHGTFRTLLRMVEDDARASGLRRLTTFASIMAEPAFAACGWQGGAWEVVARGDERLRRRAMHRTLDP